jgi:hypothetical protein
LVDGMVAAAGSCNSGQMRARAPLLEEFARCGLIPLVGGVCEVRAGCLLARWRWGGGEALADCPTCRHGYWWWGSCFGVVAMLVCWVCSSLFGGGGRGGEFYESHCVCVSKEVLTLSSCGGGVCGRALMIYQQQPADASSCVERNLSLCRAPKRVLV